VKVLVACEFSGIVRDAFIKAGHDAISCDILPSELPGPHHLGAVEQILWSVNWDMIIAHPPCTYLCNSGVRWLKGNPERFVQMERAAHFFNIFLSNSCPKIVVENPIPHKYARETLLRDYDQIVQPWQFGHGESKATCLWLKGVPPLKPTNIVDGREGRIHKMPPGKDRGHQRSRTYPGIAQAMAEQWGDVRTWKRKKECGFFAERGYCPKLKTFMKNMDCLNCQKFWNGNDTTTSHANPGMNPGDAGHDDGRENVVE
jgi:hypothetical protein